ncbi:lysylphosphatidylglycerol synthase domain-containing protein [Actinomadura sp. WMMB 499]|uniref:lysylphosphatidylglycerol synthase domain-containing protein n=1 Tax=Actinomadura sp. WMMB 499 TaxID=1219491 RepID=UPI00159E2973|nr:lysylphosphatidylglycerol synthase domain-containing protein [Actinomadura sp. WMMB 499]
MQPTASRPPATRTRRIALAAVAAPLVAIAVVAARETRLPDVHWGVVPPLIALTALHYVLSAVALRAAAGRPLPLASTALAQCTASAANRVTPGGLGAFAVNTRYLARHGSTTGRAAVTVAAVRVAGLPADLALLCLVVGLGGPDGRFAGALGARAARIAGAVPPVPSLMAALLLLPLTLWAARSAAVRRAVSTLTELCRRPRDLAVVLTASAAATAAVGAAFALSVLAVPGTSARPGDALALVAAYMVGAAAGAAVPTPGGAGSTEAALVGTLALLAVPTGPALHAVLLFRVVTHWGPVPVGLAAYRTLCR